MGHERSSVAKTMRLVAQNALKFGTVIRNKPAIMSWYIRIMSLHRKYEKTALDFESQVQQCVYWLDEHI